MASNGLEIIAKKGKCRICQRVRCVNKYLKAVGEVRHGFATGRIWECVNTDDCLCAAEKKLINPSVNHSTKIKIKAAIMQGHFNEYKIYN